MARRGLAAAVLLLASCSPGRQASEPPERYRSDTTAAVRFLAPDKAAAICAGAIHEAGVTPEACNLGSVMVLPNPCAWPGTDTYAELVCHELGHWNGWPADHPKT